MEKVVTGTSGHRNKPLQMGFGLVLFVCLLVFAEQFESKLQTLGHLTLKYFSRFHLHKDIFLCIHINVIPQKININS